MNGTSVAAPQCTRAIANYWQSGGTARDKASVLNAILGSQRQVTDTASPMKESRSANGRRFS
jgi:hypothetical protein